MKQEFEMTQEEMDDIISINKDKMPVLQIGDVTTGMDTQEKVNEYWKGLSEKYGFEQMSVEPSSRGRLFFLAKPKEIEEPKTQTDIEVDKYLDGTHGYVSAQVMQSLRKITEQLEKCEYECQGGVLNNNVAFLALKRMSTQK